MPQDIGQVIVHGIVVPHGTFYLAGGPTPEPIRLILMDDGTVRWERV